MWDLLKKAGVAALEAGARYARHAARVERLLRLPPQAARDELRGAVRDMDDAEFKAFRNAVDLMIGMARGRLQQARARDDDSDAWGPCVEDRIAYLQARIQAGVPQRETAAVRQAAQRLEGLEALAHAADRFRRERAAVAAPTVAPAPAFRDARVGEIGGRIEAFNRHLNAIFGDSGAHPAAAPAAGEVLAPMAALELLLACDRRLLRVMPRIMPGLASQAVVDEALDIKRDYERLLAVEPIGGTYTHAQVRAKIADCLDFAGAARESMREDAAAVGLYRQAAAMYDQLGDAAKARRVRGKIDAIEVAAGGDVDAEVERLQRKLLAETAPTLGRAETLLALGEAMLGADDTYGAREHLLEAETILREHTGGEPDAGDLAEALMSSMRALRSGEKAGDTEIERKVRVCALYARLYHALYAAFEGDDPGRADGYLEKAEAMDSRAASKAFGDHALKLLASGYGDLLK